MKKTQSVQSLSNMKKLLCNNILFLALQFLFCRAISSELHKSDTTDDTREQKAAEYLESLEPKYSQKCKEQAESGWEFETNITKENEERSVGSISHLFLVQ